MMYFRVMPHSKSVDRISENDNPSEKAPKYPGKYRKNHSNGVPRTKEEWLGDQTDVWLPGMRKVQSKPMGTFLQ